MSQSYAAIIVNTRSGHAPTEAHAQSRRLAQRLAERGVRARSIAFGGDGSWRGQMDAILAGRRGCVYVLGGDGTVLAVASALLGREIPLGIVPLGTANLLARDLGLPAEPARVVDALMDASVRRIDVGQVNGRPFLCASMLGLTTALAKAREADRGSNPLKLWPTLMRKTLDLLARYPYREVRMETDAGTIELHTRAMIVSNNPVVPEPGLLFPRRAGLDGGRLGLYGIHRGPTWELPRLVLRLLLGTWMDDPRIFHHDASSLTLDAADPHRQGRRVDVLNDGEHLKLRIPLRYEVLPAALPVLAPVRRDTEGVPAMPSLRRLPRPMAPRPSPNLSPSANDPARPHLRIRRHPSGQSRRGAGRHAAAPSAAG
jgi:diacylglycerol kinase family enzyme